MDNKISILFVTHSKKKGGAEQSLIHLINHLNIEKFNIFLLCPPETEYLNDIRVPFTKINMELISLKRSLGIIYIKNVYFINKFVKKFNIDIIHANGWRAPWYVAPIKYLSNTKTIWHHRDIMKSKLYNNFLPLFFDQIICISECVKNTLKIKQRKKISVVYNGVEVNNKVLNIRKRSFKEDGIFVVGSFGRIVEWKRYDYIIKALKLFAERNRDADWKYFIVGGTEVDGSPDYLVYLKELVNSLGLQGNISFLGHQENPIKIMSKCDITINFSDQEPFGRVIIESLIAKTPVIVANSGGAPEIIYKTDGGLICEDANIQMLAEKINYIYNMNSTDYEKLRTNGFNKVCEFFNMEKLAFQIYEIYYSLISKQLV